MDAAALQQVLNERDQGLAILKDDTEELRNSLSCKLYFLSVNFFSLDNLLLLGTVAQALDGSSDPRFCIPIVHAPDCNLVAPSQHTSSLVHRSSCVHHSGHHSDRFDPFLVKSMRPAAQ